MASIQKLSNQKGEAFAVYMPIDGRLPAKLKKRSFASADDAKTFVKGFAKEQSYWRRLLLQVESVEVSRMDDDALYSAVARQLVRGKIRFLDITRSERAKASASARTFRKSGQSSIIISPASDLVGVGTKAKQKTFRSKVEAFEFLDELAASPEQLSAMSESVGIQGFDDIDRLEKLADALHKGDAVALETKVATPKPKIEAEAASDMPGAKPVESPPPADESAAPVEQAVSDADQAQALTEAAESGAAFCEDCAAEEGADTESTGVPGKAVARPEGAVDETAAVAAGAREEDGAEQKPKCELLSVSMVCSHGRKPKNGHLEVVPSEVGDKIKLKANIKESCGNHAKWDVVGPIGHSSGVGSTFEFKANSWRVGSSSPRVLNDADPQKYEVSVEACGGRETLTVWSYPSDKISLKVNGMGGDKTWQDRLSYIESSMSQYLKKFSFSAPSGSVSFSGQWVENENREDAFYRYQISGGFTPIIGLTGRFPIGPTAGIPNWVKTYGDFYCFIEFAGSISATLNFERLRPEKHTAYLEAKGTFEGKVGASLFLVDESVLKVEAFGTSGINLKGWTDKELTEPATFWQFDWEGLKVVLSIQLGWGWVEVSREWNIVDGGPLHKDPYEINVKDFFNK